MKIKLDNGVIAEVAGWYGAIAILVAYFLVSFEMIAADGLMFQLLNFTGALGLIIIALQKRVTQSVVLNLFWAGVAVIAIMRMTI